MGGAAGFANFGVAHIANIDEVLAAGVNAIQFDVTPDTGTQTPGKVRWDETNGTLAIELTNPGGGNDVTLQVGQETHIYAKNTSGAKILNGQVVRISGASSNRVAVALAQADTLANAKAIAMATADVEINGFGYFTEFGNVGSINTNAYSEGDILYLSAATAGGLTATAPTGTNVVVEVGTVTNKSTNQGSIHVRITYPETAVHHALAQATTVPAQRTALGLGTGDSPTFTGLTLTGRAVVSVQSVTSAAGTTVVGDVCMVNVTGTTTHTLTLPAAATGRAVTIKNSSTGLVTINRAGSDTIDGSTSTTLTRYQAITLIANGTDWCIV